MVEIPDTARMDVNKLQNGSTKQIYSKRSVDGGEGRPTHRKKHKTLT